MDVEQALHSQRILPLDVAAGEIIEFSLDEEIESTPEGVEAVASMFKEEKVPVRFWIRVIEEYWRLGSYSCAIDFANQALDSQSPLSSIPHSHMIIR